MLTVNKTTTEQNSSTGKWAVWFEIWRVKHTEKYVSANCGSAHVFDTSEQAWAAGDRAVDLFNKTGIFPNMCEQF